MPTSSVLINNYNNGPYLKECVESALAQTQPADEVIVYDDGSTDDSLAILRSFKKRITLIEGARTGLPSRAAQAHAMYEAYSKSRGKKLFLLDGDDRFHPEKIATYSRAFAANKNAALVQAPLCEIDATGRHLGTNLNPLKHKDDYLAATYQLNDADFYYPTSALAFTRSFLEKALPLDFSDNIALSIDTRLGMIAPLYGPVISLDSAFSDWRRHPKSYSTQPGRYKVQMFATLNRTKVFNGYCRAHGFRQIQLWRNRRFYLQLLRAVAPGFLYSAYHNYVRSTAPVAPAKTHLAGPR
jgi:glycosyltransferase involved in cell wall biosynthesis